MLRDAGNLKVDTSKDPFRTAEEYQCMNQKKPLFSIVTVCYNSERTIERTLVSVEKQSCKDYEYIIVDGNSRDNTNNIIKRHLNNFEINVSYLTESDNGIYDAMNKGINLAQGRYICFLNSDDWFEDDALEVMKDAHAEFVASQNTSELEYDKCVVIYGGQRTIMNGLEENCVFYNHQFLTQNMICHQACFTSKSCFEKFGLFNDKLKSAADYEFTLKLFLSGDVTFVPVHKTIVNFSSGGMNESYVGRAETNRIRLEQGIISKKAYRLEKIKMIASKLTYFLLRKKPQKVTS